MLKHVWFAVVFVLVFTFSLNGSVAAETTTASATTFVETFDVSTTSPQPFNPDNWDMVIHSREFPNGKLLQTSTAQVNKGCQRFGTNHTISALEDAAYACGGTLHTSMRSDSYGLIYFTPDHMVDFSNGEAVIRWEMSTQRGTSRDWVDIWVTPYEDNLQLTLDNWLPDLSGEPKRSVHVSQTMSWEAKFRAEVYDNFVRNELPGTSQSWQGYEAFMTPSFDQLETFELRISQNRVKFGMPDYDFWWVDDAINLNWNQGVVQFGFHSYNPLKSCDYDGSCFTSTYQWDNVEISPAVPFYMNKGDRTWVDPTVDTTINFDEPAPANAHLRFGGIGSNLEVSFDNGSSWTTAQFQAQQQDLFVDDHFKSYWMPIPAGTQSVSFRGQKWFDNDWMVKEVAVWAPNGSASGGSGGGGDSAEPSCNVIDFSTSDMHSYDSWQDNGNLTVFSGANAIKLSNNAWKALTIPSYQLTNNTMLEFEFKSDVQGEEHAIGLDNDWSYTPNQRFKLYGTQNTSQAAFQNFATYSGNGSYQPFSIPVGQFMSGSFSELVFSADHDGGAQNGTSYFRNVRLVEAGQCSPLTSGNNAPNIVTPNAQLGRVGNWVSLDIIASDIDGDFVTLSPRDLPEGLSLNNNNQIVGTLQQAGTYNVSISANDNNGGQDTAAFTWTVASSSSEAACTTNSGLLFERWNGIQGTSLVDLRGAAAYPNNPSEQAIIGGFEIPTNTSNAYGVRLRGYVEAPVSGNYTFWMASDDNGSLLLSTDANVGNAREIASVPAWTHSREWGKYDSQQSAEIFLQAGQQYYIEALMKEWGGGDNLAVAWQIPGGSRELISASALCSFDGNTPNTNTPTAVIAASTLSGATPLPVDFSAVGSFDGDGNIVSYEWEFGNGVIAYGATSSHIYTNEGTYTVRLTVTDNDGLTNSAYVDIAVGSGGSTACTTNGVTRQQWDGIWSGNVAGLLGDARYPNSPTSSSLLSNFAAPSNIADGYGARMQAFLMAPETGSYTFYLASDNEGQLNLSSDANPANAVQIAQTWWSPQEDWNSAATSQSINLTAGQMYYIEGLHHAAWSDDYYAVAWTTPSNGTPTIIPNSALCAFENGGRSAEAADADSADAQSISAIASDMLVSDAVANLPLDLYDDLAMVMIDDADLVAEALDLRDTFAQMIANGATVDASFVAEVTSLYGQFYAAASPDLQQWLSSQWSQLNTASMQGMSAESAWETVNDLSSSTPTAVTLSESGAETERDWNMAMFAALLSVITLMATALPTLPESIAS